MKSIKQINGSYLLEPDRIMLRISTLDDNEYPLLLTRRVACLLIDELQYHILESNPQGSKFNAKAIEVFKQEMVAESTNFSAVYEGGKTHPIGKTPYLITKIKLAKNRKHVHTFFMSFVLRGHDPITFLVNLPLMRVTLEFLNKLQGHAQVYVV